MSNGQDTAPVVTVRGLRIVLEDSETEIVDDVSFSVQPGKVLGLVGESGSGKTTVGMSLLGFSRPGACIAGGQVRVGDDEILDMSPHQLRSIRGKRVSYIPQDPGTALNPALRIGRQLSEVLVEHAPELDAEARLARIRQVLEEVALPPTDYFLRRYPHQLSGGQQQRVAIAMAFACRAAVIVCDEPTTGLDVTTQARVLATLRDLCQEYQVAAIYVSHDLAVIADLADTVAVMYAGRIVEYGPSQTVIGAPRHPYTQRLLRAVPARDGARGLSGIAGHAPPPGERSGGCQFADRCHLAIDRCRVEIPSLLPIAGREVACHRAEEPIIPIPDAPRRTATVRSDRAPLLEIHSFEATYGRVSILHDIELTVAPDECVALVGESGSGKTTLARSVAGLHPGQTGTVRFAGVDLAPVARNRSTEARREIQYIFQNPYASLNPRLTVGQTIERQLKHFKRADRRGAAQTVAECLERVSLPARAAHRFPNQLSGGERQRVAIARALAADPRLLVCDEVTSALDVSVQASIVNLLDEIRANTGMSMLFITHNLPLIRTIADRVIVMTGGRIVDEGLTADIFERSTVEYTRSLVDNSPALDGDGGDVSTRAHMTGSGV